MAIKEKLIDIVGTTRVTDETAKLESYTKDKSLNVPGRPSYIVQAESTAEVQKIVQLANTHKVPITPCSSGINFYGNTIPVQAGIILDLSKMNKIMAVDDRNRMVRFEPGVTWGQLQTELQKQDLMAISPLLPHPLKSALTSHLEREPRLIPKFEYTDSLVTMEIILPDGELFRTGSASAPGFPEKSFAQGVNPSGPGDFMWNRIFQGAQGTFGVVTWVQCKIEYRPKVNKTYFVPFKNLAEAASFIYKIQWHEVGEECLLLNSVDLAAILTEKWPGDFNKLKTSLAPWTLIMVLGGGKRLPEQKIAYEEDALKEVAGELSIATLPTSISGIPGIEQKLPDMLRNAWPEAKTYWKSGYKGSCQDFFFLTKLNETEKFLQIITEIAHKYDYPANDIGVYIQPMVYGGACHFECNFFYNADNAMEAYTVNKMYLEAASTVLDKGGFFSRPYGPIANMVYNRAASYTATLRKLKKVLDPNMVMSPGRLCF
ncbi:MAG: FAD-binding oxidoreductase [Dehalococcoidales bacterium]|nr:FAD-binding oxidoreductase [Dehalococcoidales bacterium]